jgi:hypothetical protein
MAVNSHAPTTKQTFGASAVRCDGLGARTRQLEKCRHASIHRCRQSPAGAADLLAANLFAGALCWSIPSPADAPARRKVTKLAQKVSTDDLTEAVGWADYRVASFDAKSPTRRDQAFHRRAAFGCNFEDRH